MVGSFFLSLLWNLVERTFQGRGPTKISQLLRENPLGLKLRRAQSEKVVVVIVTQLGLTLCDPMDCSPPGSFVHGISQARMLEWVAISFSRGSSQPKD